jgi:predicted transcriptional regulator
MKQASLFENSAPIAATRDPVTSHLAAEELTDSGARDAQKSAVLASLKREPVPPTSRELARSAKLDRHAVARRLPDLESDGLVRKAGMRTCSISGKMCVTWAIVRSA